MAQTKILVVEDDILIARNLQRGLQAAGYEVPKYVVSGEEAVQQALSSPPDIILMDIQLAGEMTGIEAAQQIRAHYDLPIVFLSAYSDKATLQEAIMAEPFGYLLKPFREQELRITLEMALYKHTMDRKLHQSESKYRTLFASSPVAILLLGLDGTVLDCNAKASEISGFAYEEIVGRPLLASGIEAEDDIIRCRQLFAQVVSGQDIGQPRFKIKHKQGEERWIDVSMVGLHEKEQLQAIQVIARDISEQMQARQALQESSDELERRVAQRTQELARSNLALQAEAARRAQVENKYYNIFEHAVEGIYQSTSDGRFISVNPAMARILGYESTEALIDTVADIKNQLYLQPDNREDFKRQIEAQGSIHGFVTQYKKKDGTAIWISNSARCVYAEDGRVLYYEGTLEDITERTEMEKALLASGRQYAALVNSVDGIVWERDLESQCFTFVSQRAENLLGYSTAEWLSDPSFWFNHLHLDDRAQVANYCDAQTNASGVHTFEYRMLAQDGRAVWLRDIVSVIIEAGRPKHLRGIMVDITESKNSEAKIKLGHQQQSLISSLLQLSLENLALQTQLECFLDTILSISWLPVMQQGAIYLIGSDSGALELRAARGPQPDAMAYCASLPLGKCITGQAAGKLTNLLDCFSGVNEPCLMLFDPGRQYCIPICSAEHVMGAIVLHMDAGYQPLEDDGAFLNTVANTLAGMIERNRAYTALHNTLVDLERRVTERTLDLTDTNQQLKLEIDERIQTQKALQREAGVNASMAVLAQALISAATIDEVSDLVLEHAGRLTGSEVGYVGHIDPHTGYLVSSTLSRDVWSDCQVNAAAGDQAVVFHQFKGLWGWVLNHGAPLLSNDPQNDLRSSGVPAGHIAIRRFLSAPAMIGDELVGQIALANAAQPYSDQDLAVVQRLASMFAIAVQRKRVEQQLHLQSTALEAAANAIIIADRSGIINWINPAFTRLTGYTQDEVRGGKPSLLKSGRHSPAFYQDLWQTILAGKTWHGELINRHKDAQLYYEEMTITPVRDAHGEILHFVAVKQDITERKQAEKELQRYAEEQAMLYTVTASASAFLDPQALLAKVSEVLANTLNADRVWVILGEDVGGNMRNIWSRGVTANSLPDASRDAIQNLCAKCAVRTQEDLALGPQRISGCPDLMALLADQSVEHLSHICIPLAVSNRTLGVMTLVWDNSTPAVQTGGQVWVTIGRQIGLALRNAQLYQTALQVDRLQALNMISAAATSSLEMPAVLHEILKMTCSVLNTEEGAILLLDPHTNELVFEMTLSEGTAMLRGRRLAPGQGAAGWVVENQQSVMIRNVADDPRWYSGVDQLSSHATQSLLCAPLIYHEKLRGVIELVNKRQGEFSHDDLSLLEAVAGVAATTIENARLFAATRTRAQELEALYNLGLALGVTLDSAAVIGSAILQLEKLFAADILAVWEYDPQSGSLEIIQATERSQPVVISRPINLNNSLAGCVVQSRQPVLLANVNADPNIILQLLEYTQIKDGSAMAAPLLRPERVIGAIVVVKEALNAYSAQDLRLLESVASTLAITLENARLYESLKELLDVHQKTEAQLIQTEKIAALGRLSASIAHEINNPLQAVQGCLSLLGEEIVGRQRKEKLDRYLGIVTSEIERVADIVARMRDFYRPARVETQATDVVQVLESVLELTDKQLQHSEVAVECDWTADLPVIQSNPSHLKQVFLNLVLNAIDAQPHGGRLDVSAAMDTMQRPNQPLQPALRIQFQDRGQGMTPEVLSQLFEPFFTTKERGSGLGLYVSYTIIESFGGQLSVQSQPGVGATFTILLPLNPKQDNTTTV